MYKPFQHPAGQGSRRPSPMGKPTGRPPDWISQHPPTTLKSGGRTFLSTLSTWRKTTHYFLSFSNERGGTGMNGRKPCILVTGGATPLYRRIRLALRAEGYDVLKASSYSRAVAMTHGYRPDLVLLDMDLPGTMDGFDFCSMIRQSLQTPIIAISVQANLQRT